MKVLSSELTVLPLFGGSSVSLIQSKPVLRFQKPCFLEIISFFLSEKNKTWKRLFVLIKNTSEACLHCLSHANEANEIDI